MERRYGKLENAGDVIKEAGQGTFGSEAFQFWLFQNRWPSIIGKTLAQESYIGRREGRMLYIYVTNSVWMQELMMHRAEILRRIQQDPYGARFGELRIMMGVPRPKVEPSSTVDRLRKKYEETEKVMTAPLSEGEERWVAAWTEAHIQKEEIRGPIARLMEGAIRRRKGEIAAGWHPCRRCGALCPPENALCPPCQIQEERQRIHKIILILKEHPSFLYGNVRALMPCTYGEFADARDRLIHRYKENYYHGYGNEEETRKLLSLLIHKPYDEISKEEAEKTLSALPKKKLGIRN